MIFAVFSSKEKVEYGGKFNTLHDLKDWLETPTMKKEKWEQIAVFNLEAPNYHVPVIKRAKRQV